MGLIKKLSGPTGWKQKVAKYNGLVTKLSGPTGWKQEVAKYNGFDHKTFWPYRLKSKSRQI